METVHLGPESLGGDAEGGGLQSQGKRGAPLGIHSGPPTCGEWVVGHGMGLSHIDLTCTYLK